MTYQEHVKVLTIYYYYVVAISIIMKTLTSPVAICFTLSSSAQVYEVKVVKFNEHAHKAIDPLYGTFPEICPRTFPIPLHSSIYNMGLRKPRERMESNHQQLLLKESSTQLLKYSLCKLLYTIPDFQISEKLHGLRL